MDAGIAALLGAAIGVASGPLSVWFTDHLRYRRGDKADSLRRSRLTNILMQPKRKFHELEELANNIGTDDEHTKDLLIEIGARPSLARGSSKWALISRAPYPDAAASENEE